MFLPYLRRRLPLIFPLFLLAASFGCATAPVQDRTGAVVIGDVPFFSQEDRQCGPTSLAIVMDYWYRKTGAGKWITPEQIGASLYSPSAGGVLDIDLEVYAQKHGFATEQYSGSLADLKGRVDRGVPAIIFVDYGFLSYEVNHFMVVKGYTKNGVIVNSGRLQDQAVTDG